jgi:hypothetical protein
MVRRPRIFGLTTTDHNLAFTDACRTYELTWAIREASEFSRQQKLDASKAVADTQKAERGSV